MRNIAFHMIHAERFRTLSGARRNQSEPWALAAKLAYFGAALAMLAAVVAGFLVS